MGELKTVTEWPDAQSFYKEHMQASLPLVIRRGAKVTELPLPSCSPTLGATAVLCILLAPMMTD